MPADSIPQLPQDPNFVFGVSALPQALDSAYASHYASLPASGVASTSASHSVSPTKARWDSCYQSKVNSALNSRSVSPSRCRGRPSSSSVESAVASRRTSRACSPERRQQQQQQQHQQQQHQQQAASPYAVVLPRGQIRLLDESAAIQLCRRSLCDELTSAASWLDRLDWRSARAFEAASDEAAVMEEEFRSRYTCEPPSVADEDDDSLIVLADTLLSMVDTAWTDENEAENEMKIDGRPMQVHQRSSKPKKEDAIYNVRYKTLPCLHWQKNRTCPAGDHCHFAHGPQELRQPQKHPKFKTQVCQNFKKTGKCQFGSRCFFKHSS